MENNNEFQEYETFLMEVNGEETEFAILDDFKMGDAAYVAAGKIIEDSISDEGIYLFKCFDDGDTVEKITDAEEYEKVSAFYLEL